MIPASEEQERALVDALKRGDDDAKMAFYEQLYRYLTAVCSRYVVSDEDVKDLIQELFIKIFKRIEQFEWRGPGSLQAWSHRLAVNEALMYLRSKRRHPFLPIEWFEEQSVEEEYVDNPEIEGIPIKELETMIRKLPERYRTVFNLYVIEDKSHAEIAAMLGIKKDTSASNLHRAKALISKYIYDYNRRHRNGR